MPFKPLPKELVERLKSHVKNNSFGFGALGGLPIVDPYRKKVRASRKTTSVPGRRVRKLDVKRNFPNHPVVIKRTHDPASWTIASVQIKVEKHNKRYSNPHEYIFSLSRISPLFWT